MNFAKKLGRALMLSLLRLCLILLPPLIAIVYIFGNASHLEHTLQGSGIYSNIVTAVIDQSIPNNTDAQAKAVLSDPGVRSAVNDAFSPNFVKGTTEQTTDSIYAWLQGKTDQPNIAIDLSQPLQQLTTNLVAYAQKRAETLPACTISQLKSLNTSQTILSLPCLPPGFDTKKAATEFSNDIVTNTNLLQTQRITTNSLPKDESGRNVFQRLSYMPKLYKLLMAVPYIVGGLAALLAIGYIFTDRDRRSGIQKIAWSLIGTGVFWLLGVIMYTLMFTHIHLNLTTIANVPLQTSITDFIAHIARELNVATGIVAALYILIGTTTVLILWRIRPAVPQAAGEQLSDTISSQNEQLAVTNDTTGEKQ